MDRFMNLSTGIIFLIPFVTTLFTLGFGLWFKKDDIIPMMVFAFLLSLVFICGPLFLLCTCIALIVYG